MRSATLLLLTLVALLVASPLAFGALGALRATGVSPQSSRPASRPARAGFDHTHTAWTRVLKSHVRSGQVNYAKLKKNHAELDAYLATLEAVTPTQLKSWSRDQRFAVWINGYNAYTVNLIVDNYPVKSIQELGTMMTQVWKRPLVPLQHLVPDAKGKKLSLDTIEHEILRPHFEDARVHVAVNCASESCPPLRNEAFVADKLDRQLDEQAKAWLANDALNRYDRTATRVQISKLFEWFERDFLRAEGSVQAWLAKYAPDEHAAWIKKAKNLKVEYLEYSWKLNETK